MSELDPAEEAIFNAARQVSGTEKLRAFLDLMCDGKPELQARIERLLAAANEADGFFGRVGHHPPDLPARDVSPVTVAIPPTEGPGDRIGRYKLLQVIGEGGMGVVYMAEQEEPVRRRVALKIIKLGMDTRQVVARFEAERQALALMDHPNIARVLDGGATETGRPYFVMELVQGVPITEFCDRNKLSAQNRLKLFIQVCQAIQSAHQKGIIHRDIKPSNVLVTLHHGEPMPKVIDFGVAKATNQKLTEKTLFTQYATMVGTPAYMSPEQAEMSSLDVDTRTDVYALGVLLYELLTGTTPFPEMRLRSLGYGEMQRVIVEEEPERPSTRLSTMGNEQKSAVAATHSQDFRALTKLLRGDLDWIVMKCLEKDRTRRYETANGLAADLTRHLQNEPVTARPPTTAYKLKKAWRRNRIAYAAGLAIALSLLIGLAISLRQSRRAWLAEGEQARLYKVATMQRQRAQERESEARHRAYASDMKIAKLALDENNLSHSWDMLNQHRPKPGETDLRGWEWRYLWSQTRGDALFTLCRESSEIHSLSVSADGNLLAATAYGRGGLSLWSLSGRRELLRLAEGEQAVYAAMSPTEPLLAYTGFTHDPAGTQRSLLRLWNLSTRQTIKEQRLDGECVNLTISRDGSTLVTFTAGDRTAYKVGGHITLWGLPEGTANKRYPCQPDSNWRPAFAVTSDLTCAAYVESGRGLRVIDLLDGRELWYNDSHADVLAFSPDGTILAMGGGSAGADILLLEASSGRELGRLPGHRWRVMSLVFWPDGTKLASGSSDRTIRIWDIPNLSCTDTLFGHGQEVWALALMTDKRTLISGCQDGAVCLWDASVPHPRVPRIEIPDSALAWAFEGEGKSVVTLNDQGRVTRWKGENFEISEPLLETGEAGVRSGFAERCFSRDGGRLALGAVDGVIQVWDIPRRALWRQITNSPGQARVLFAEGSRLLTLSVTNFLIREWDLLTASEVQSWQAPADIIHLALSPDERHCVTLGYTGEVVVRDLTQKLTTKVNLNIQKSHDGNYSQDGRMMAVPSSLGFVRIWDPATWTEIKTLGGFFNEVFGSVFMPNDGRLVAAAGGREAIRLYDTTIWEATLTLEADVGTLWPTRVSPDGNVIGATTFFGGWRLLLWRAPSWDDIKQAELKEKTAGDQL